jgi:hypothetical protein
MYAVPAVRSVLMMTTSTYAVVLLALRTRLVTSTVRDAAMYYTMLGLCQSALCCRMRCVYGSYNTPPTTAKRSSECARFDTFALAAKLNCFGTEGRPPSAVS